MEMEREITFDAVFFEIEYGKRDARMWGIWY